ncbi:hypothetical protein [Streptomyces montanisoli]|uniref:Uncharacterized protein n=1 Tax=Streptomyces montanisoli TaxID=2798581 RepID=A0A940MD92_9ACTN|nr:hypothetical protein [Streptomyces montanisoli]MBP0458773.1 hypothetical protein [Streptomyces montanisoli]
MAHTTPEAAPVTDADAEDGIQEVFLRTIRNASRAFRFDEVSLAAPSTTILTWFTGTA